MTTILPFLRRDKDRHNRPPMTPRAKVIAVITTVVVVGAAGFGAWAVSQVTIHYLDTCANTGLTVVLKDSGGECVGATDGSSFSFSSGWNDKTAEGELAGVARKISTEDARVRATKNYETVAFLLPISSTGGGVETNTTTIEQLEGAYAAQYYANRHDVGAGDYPQIQLLIASSGTQAAGYTTTDTILENDVRTQRLAAVAGISLSLTQTVAEGKELTGAGIPVVGSTITSDDFDDIPGLVRVAPSNQQEVQAALAYIKPHVHNAMLIADMNTGDNFNTTLIQKFEPGFPDKTHSIIGPENYDTTGEISPGDPAGQEVNRRLGDMTTDICSRHPDAVFFGGRGRELGILLGDLADSLCGATIMTGDSVTNMNITPGVTSALKNNLVKVEYVGTASGDEWDYASSDPRYKNVSPSVVQLGKDGFSQFEKAFTAVGYSGESAVSDGNAMIAYDSAFSAITAIRLSPLSASPAEKTRAVGQELNAIQGSRTVHGAGGPIVFSGSSLEGTGQNSNPVGKVIPVLHLKQDGSAELLALEP